MKTFLKAFILASVVTIAGCSPEADIVSQNISKDADNFKILRRVVFYNGVTGEYILQLEGFCSIGNNDTPKRMSVTCKDKQGGYAKHFLGLSDNVTFFSEQINGAKVSSDHYKVIFKPSAILPIVEMR